MCGIAKEMDSAMAHGWFRDVFGTVRVSGEMGVSRVWTAGATWRHGGLGAKLVQPLCDLVIDVTASAGGGLFGASTSMALQVVVGNSEAVTIPLQSP